MLGLIESEQPMKAMTMRRVFFHRLLLFAEAQYIRGLKPLLPGYYICER